jgi:hypothetical protein
MGKRRVAGVGEAAVVLPLPDSPDPDRGLGFLMERLRRTGELSRGLSPQPQAFPGVSAE